MYSQPPVAEEEELVPTVLQPEDDMEKPLEEASSHRDDLDNVDSTDSDDSVNGDASSVSESVSNCSESCHRHVDCAATALETEEDVDETDSDGEEQLAPFKQKFEMLPPSEQLRVGFNVLQRLNSLRDKEDDQATVFV